MFAQIKIDPERVISCSDAPIKPGPVVYWMSRDQRVRDNWALLYAAKQALKTEQTLMVVFCLQPVFLEATIRQFDFMLQGLQEVENQLRELSIPFYVVAGEPVKVFAKFVSQKKIGQVVADFSPLKISRKWQNEVAEKIAVQLTVVDAHNVVPLAKASPKQEFAARTIRPKIHKNLDHFLTEFPNGVLKKVGSHNAKKIEWQALYSQLEVDQTVKPVTIKSGSKAADDQLRWFVKKALAGYSQDRNDPNKNSLSGLSPYLHFGQIAAQRIALEIQKTTAPKEDKQAYLEELIVRKELSDNFCYYNQDYDSFDGFPAWAQKTLNEHRADEREFTYSKKQFEQSQTHDLLWNAAQREMVTTGKMHGYLRMYWAKKILEWTPTPEAALKIAIYLNDRYQLDGRDPNGYVGIAWSIGGVHDRAWFERPIFGKVRFMAESGCRRKFDVDTYILKHLSTKNV